MAKNDMNTRFHKKDALYLVTLKYTHISLKCTKQMTNEGMFAA